MSESQLDTKRAIKAAKEIFDGRNPDKEMADICITLEQLIALMLLMLMHKDARKAAHMFNEAIVPGVEARLAMYVAKKG